MAPHIDMTLESLYGGGGVGHRRGDNANISNLTEGKAWQTMFVIYTSYL
jgi:hypothetical protein